MITLELPKMIKKISSLVEDESVKYTIHKNNITITTETWDFNFEYQPPLSCYLYDSIRVNNCKLDLDLQDLKKTLMRELICKYGITVNS